MALYAVLTSLTLLATTLLAGKWRTFAGLAVGAGATVLVWLWH